MKASPAILRKLSHIEQAFTLSNDHDPLCVICVLRLSNGPDIPTLESSLAKLQQRHTLLQVGISKKGRQYFFHALDPVPSVDLQVEQRADSNTYRTALEKALNTTFNRSGPLMKCVYVSNPEGKSELIVCFHHAIIDGTAARLILHEILSLTGGVPLPEPEARLAQPLFPPAFRGWHLGRRILALMGRQLKEMRRYRRHGLQSPIPSKSKNATISIELTPALSRKLSVRAGREGISLNTLILAAMTQAVQKYRYPNIGQKWARVISFADLREGLVPPPTDQQLGCFVSMLRISVPVSREQSIWDLAAQIRSGLFQAGKKGEVFLMSWLSKYLMQMTFRLKNDRLGVSALSFIGPLDLQAAYGSIQLEGVEAYITNNRFGTEFSAFGKILFGSIGLDFNYLTEEINTEQAKQIVQEIRGTLEKLAENP